MDASYISITVIDYLALRTIAGYYGEGLTRILSLGDLYDKVQDRVDEILADVEMIGLKND